MPLDHMKWQYDRLVAPNVLNLSREFNKYFALLMVQALAKVWMTEADLHKFVVSTVLEQYPHMNEEEQGQVKMAFDMYLKRQKKYPEDILESALAFAKEHLTESGCLDAYRNISSSPSAVDIQGR